MGNKHEHYLTSMSKKILFKILQQKCGTVEKFVSQSITFLKKKEKLFKERIEKDKNKDDLYEKRIR